jgi:chromosome segregation ATPase
MGFAHHQNKTNKIPTAAELREAVEAETELITLKDRRDKVVKDLESLQVELRTLNLKISQLQHKQTELLSPKKNLIQASTSELLQLHLAKNPH